jgi:DNA repair photolyase
MEQDQKQSKVRRGRGATINASGRFEPLARVDMDDGWESLADLPPLKTEVALEAARHIITRNTSPDVPFDRSINPYRGCEHGCIYCFARPTHAYMGLSPGLDFETRLFAKPNAAKLLRAELMKPGYKPKPIAIGTNTDPYQPIEKTQRIMRALLEVLAELKHPVMITTKSAMVARDIDILATMAEDRLVNVTLSVTTLDKRLARAMEPRASTPVRRLSAIEALTEAGIPTWVNASPMIPALNDHELEGDFAGGAPGRRVGGQLHSASVTAGGPRYLQELAGGALPRALPARALGAAFHAWWGRL